MSGRVSVRRSLLFCTGLAVLALLALLVAGSRGQAVRTFALGAPNFLRVAVLRPSSQVCEGPISSHGSARSVGIWGSSSGAPAQLTVVVRDSRTHRALASGKLQAAAGQSEYRVRLARAVPGSRALQVCLTDDLNAFSLSGSAAINPGVQMTGAVNGGEFSLVLLSDSDRSVLSSLPTAFSRASLWRPSWVGSWTFWLLTIALLLTFGLAVAAVTSAATADGGPDGPQPDGPKPDGPHGDQPSSASHGGQPS